VSEPEGAAVTAHGSPSRAITRRWCPGPGSPGARSRQIEFIGDSFTLGINDFFTANYVPAHVHRHRAADVKERHAQGDGQVRYWYYETSGLDFLGCDWHPSQRDHQVLASRLTDFINGLNLKSR
jgi:hypothetical protein